MSTGSDFMADLNLVGGLNAATQASKLKYGNTEDKTTLDFNDYLNLMVTTLQNQTMDNTADTGEMMNQMVQMSVMQAITDISELISSSTSLNYAASLVGKEVTVGVREGDSVKEIEGTVTGTGTLDGQQVIFIGEDCYYLNSVMAVGKLPEGEVKPNGGPATSKGDTSSTTDPDMAVGGAGSQEEKDIETPTI